MTLLCIIVYYYRHIPSKTSVQFKKLVELFSSDTNAREFPKVGFYDFVESGIENCLLMSLIIVL